MWDYTDTVMDHFRNPRNVGKIENPDGQGTVGSLACGDALTLMFKLDSNGRISEAKFQTFGCASAIASSSALTEMMLGKTIEEAETITNQDITKYLGGLPNQKIHCSVMGREALEAAIHNYRTGEETVKDLEEDHIVCTCFGVSESEIRRVVSENHLNTVDEVTNYCKAGGGCGMCHDAIQNIIEVVKTELNQESDTEAKPAKKMSNLQKMRLIEEIVEREIRPHLRKDGGDIDLIDIEGNLVTIAFRGMCAGCLSATYTRQDFIQARLREFVDPDITVVEGE